MTHEGAPDELAPGITSLSEGLSLAIAWLDGDANAGAAAANKSDSGPDDKSPSTHGASATNNTADDKQQHPLSPIEKAINILIKMQTQISRSGLISKNEGLDDVSTASLELLGVEYQLGRAFLMLPTHSIPTNNGNTSNAGPSSTSSLLRKQNVTRAIEYFHSFLKSLEQLGEDVLEEETLKEYHALLDSEEDPNDSSSSTKSRMNPSQLRQMKIQRYQRKKSTSQKQSHIQSQLQRRSRLGISDDEPMEGHDSESLSRTLYIETLRLYAEESLEEVQSSKGELEMLDMAMQMESMRAQGNVMDPRMMRGGPPQAGMMGPPGPYRMSPQQPQQPLQMTQISQHPVTGQLEFNKQRVSNGQLQPVAQTKIQRQEIANGIFRPSWNQPTMSLEELGDIERSEAIARGEAQKLAEAEAIYKPRRYDQLMKDGMEDDEKLVEASAELDRKWDDWKDENPRGSGNKMSERGDRNF